MTETEMLLRRQEVGGDIKSVVRVMKSLSAVSIKQYDTAVKTLKEYHFSVHLGLQAVLQQAALSPRIEPFPDAAEAYIVFGSDHGLCGRFNETAVKRVVARLSDAENHGRKTFTLTIGARTAAHLEASGYLSSYVLPVPDAVKVVSETVESILMWIDEKREQDKIGNVVVFNNMRTLDSLAIVQEQQLLPVTEQWLSQLKEEPWPSRGLSTFSVAADELFSILIREHLFISLFRATAESIASEHASRLSAMQRAERHIDEYLATLGAEIREHRQNSITQELLDIVASYNVLLERNDSDAET
jgi:F-type H+-transporting ATPase subunit gamma